MHPAAANDNLQHNTSSRFNQEEGKGKAPQGAVAAAIAGGRKSVRFQELFAKDNERDNFDVPLESTSGWFSGEGSSSSASSSGNEFSSDDESDEEAYAHGVLRDASSWAGNLPAAQGLVGHVPVAKNTGEARVAKRRLAFNVRSTTQRTSRTLAASA